MGKWRDLFEAGLPPFEEREYGELYEFGSPATADQIADAERAMGVRLPEDLREMLMEFNGIRYTSEAGRKYGYEPTEFYLDTEAMSVKAPGYLRNSSDPLPPQDVLEKLAFVCQVNATASCMASVSRMSSGIQQERWSGSIMRSGNWKHATRLWPTSFATVLWKRSKIFLWAPNIAIQRTRLPAGR